MLCAGDVQMARYVRKARLFPVALSQRAAGEALGIEPREIHAAIRDGELLAYKRGTHVRVLVEDLVAWVRTWTQITGVSHVD
jgi:excisionase family DNA binding protein